MADAKITELTNLATPAVEDIIPIVDDVAGTPTTKKSTLQVIADLFAGLTQTLVGKTLTSPLFQGIVDGWISANETWTYASASTITVSSGAAAKYAVGDRIRWKQGGAYKYGVLTTVADTLLTIAVNTDYTVATPTAITDNYYSHQINPIGYPIWFNLAAISMDVTDFDDGSGNQPSITKVRGSITGRLMTLHLNGSGYKATTNNILFKFTAPLLNTSNYSAGISIGNCYLSGNSGAVINVGSCVSYGATIYAFLNANITDNVQINESGCTLIYEI